MIDECLPFFNEKKVLDIRLSFSADGINGLLPAETTETDSGILRSIESMKFRGTNPLASTEARADSPVNTFADFADIYLVFAFFSL